MHKLAKINWFKALMAQWYEKDGREAFRYNILLKERKIGEMATDLSRFKEYATKMARREEQQDKEIECLKKEIHALNLLIQDLKAKQGNP